MTQATETFQAGAEQFTVAIDIGGDAVPISGDFAGTITGAAQIVGNVNLTGDMIVEGSLTGIDTFILTGNGFQLLVQDGGQLDLAGVERSAWVRWGDPVVGWQVGDRLAVAPMAVGSYTPLETTWQGTWAATTRPANAAAATLFTGQVMQPEVANLSQTIVLRNLRRVHFHDGAGVQTLKWLKVLDAGQTNTLAQYPIHFHLNGETSRGSLLEDVVVEGGKNHAFVPHGSHGITMRDCVAYRTVEDAFWWDLPDDTLVQTPGVPCPQCEPGAWGDFCMVCGSGNSTNGRQHHTANNSNDTTWDRCLVLGLNSTEPFNVFPLAGFLLGAGHGNKCLDSVATGIQRGTDPSGFHWPSQTARNDGGVTWEFRGNTAHNIGYKTISVGKGIFVWQNSPIDEHIIEDMTIFRIGKTGIDHGAYVNHYEYRRVVIDGTVGAALDIHPVSVGGQSMIFEDFNTNKKLRLDGHQIAGDGTPTYIRRSTFTEVIVAETDPNNPGLPAFASFYIFEDCPTQPANWTFTAVHPQSIFELWTGGVLQHRWAAGTWT